MADKIYMIGKRFGKLVVIEESEKVNGNCMYKCKCDCGNEKVILGARLRSGGSRTCGCGVIEATRKANKTHGLSKLQLYTLWLNIRKRCYDDKVHYYKNYGGRGIKMHAEWKDNPIEFINWCRSNGWNHGLELDRKDNDGDYIPSNLRFITHKEQQRNTRKNVFYTYNGETKCLAEWAEIIGIKYCTVGSRISRGWSIHEALFGKKNKKTWKNLNIQKAG